MNKVKPMTNMLREQAEGLAEKMVQIRRTVHSHPELGFEEVQTSILICKTLEEIGIPFKKEICKTGVVAILEGRHPTLPKRCILLRADMDALPLQEETSLPFKSQIPSQFHACGHDAHVACLLGAAELLKARVDEFAGSILFVFQPAEEGAKWKGVPSGGALPMLEEAPEIFGTRGEPKIDASLALHIVAGPDKMDLVGTVAVKDGSFTGSCDEIYIDVIGKGGHASAPHSACDPVFVACHVTVALQGWLTRFTNPVHPVVLTFGKIVGGSRTNIIPSKCRMEGTLRTLNETTREKILSELPKFVQTMAAAHGATAEVVIDRSYPVGSNDKRMNEHIRRTVTELYGPTALYEQEEPQLGAEDFYEFGFRNKIPIAMFWLGGANPDRGMIHHNHSNFFDYDERALPMGAAVLAGTTLRFLTQ